MYVEWKWNFYECSCFERKVRDRKVIYYCNGKYVGEVEFSSRGEMKNYLEIVEKIESGEKLTREEKKWVYKNYTAFSPILRCHGEPYLLEAKTDEGEYPGYWGTTTILRAYLLDPEDEDLARSILFGEDYEEEDEDYDDEDDEDEYEDDEDY